MRIKNTLKNWWKITFGTLVLAAMVYAALMLTSMPARAQDGPPKYDPQDDDTLVSEQNECSLNPDTGVICSYHCDTYYNSKTDQYHSNCYTICPFSIDYC